MSLEAVIRLDGLLNSTVFLILLHDRTPELAGSSHFTAGKFRV